MPPLPGLPLHPILQVDTDEIGKLKALVQELDPGVQSQLLKVIEGIEGVSEEIRKAEESAATVPPAAASDSFEEEGPLLVEALIPRSSLDTSTDEEFHVSTTATPTTEDTPASETSDPSIAEEEGVAESAEDLAVASSAPVAAPEAPVLTGAAVEAQRTIFTKLEKGEYAPRVTIKPEIKQYNKLATLYVLLLQNAKANAVKK